MANRYGTLGADSLTGTNTNDYISGGPLGNEAADIGNDTLLGGSGGSDEIYGWGGDDSIVGSAGSDLLFGGNGNDTIRIVEGEAYGEAGNDSIVGTGAVGTLAYFVGGTGADTLLGAASSDLLYDNNYDFLGGGLNAEADSLSGGSGADGLYSYGGADTLDGGADNDFAIIDRSALVVGFRFTPTAAGTAYVASDGTRVVNIEEFDIIAGGSGNDTLSGLGDAFTGGGEIYGNGGNDVISVSGFSSFAAGGVGNDTISVDGGRAFGGDGDDRITGANGILSGDAGDDTLIATGADGTSLAGGLGADSLVGSDGDDVLDDNSNNSFFAPDEAIDTLFGGAGNDFIRSAGGADRLDGGAGFDLAQIYLVTLTANFSLKLGAATATSTASDGTTLTGIEYVYIDGGSGKDKLTANAGDDRLTGNGGNDNLNGGKGADSLTGGDGADTLIGGAGADQLFGNAGADAFRWTALDRRNTDSIVDYGDGPDRLEFSTGALDGLLPVGVLNAANFAVNAATAAAPQFVLKENFQGSSLDYLFWDADGTGSGKAIEIAVLFNSGLTAADIVIIA